MLRGYYSVKVLMIMMLLAASMLGIASAENYQNPIVVCNDQGEKMDAAETISMMLAVVAAVSLQA